MQDKIKPRFLLCPTVAAQTNVGFEVIAPHLINRLGADLIDGPYVPGTRTKRIVGIDLIGECREVGTTAIGTVVVVIE